MDNQQYKQRLTDYLQRMPCDKRVMVTDIVKDENRQLFRSAFMEIIQERFEELGKFISYNDELTWFKKFPANIFEPITEATLSINGKRIGTLKDFNEGKLTGCFNELFK